MQSNTIHRGLSPLDGAPLEISVSGGRISAVRTLESADFTHWIAPGMIDLQVNGFAGVDYNSPAAPLDEIVRSIHVQRSSGVTRLLPTVITGSYENITGSLRNLAKVKRDSPEGLSFAGFHVEGPWISPDDGPRGAHPREHVRAPSIDEYERFQEAAEGGIRLLTLGPEHPGSTAVIEHIVGRGVTVAIGHTNADRAQIDDAVKAGATMSTHLGNGAHQTVPRHENYILYQMASDALCAGLIVDGIHLPPHFVKIAVRAKGVERTVLVTDAVAPAGCEPGIYHLGPIEVELTADQRVERTDTRRLSGSALSMDRGFENLIRFTGISLADALRTATVNPAAAIGLEDRQGFLQPGDPAEFMLFDYDAESGAVRVTETVIPA